MSNRRRATTLLGEEVRYHFGRRLRRLRRDRDLSQEAVAHMAGLDRTYVSGVERGELSCRPPIMSYETCPM